MPGAPKAPGFFFAFHARTGIFQPQEGLLGGI
jgi:hypothetical protein